MLSCLHLILHTCCILILNWRLSSRFDMWVIKHANWVLVDINLESVIGILKAHVIWISNEPCRILCFLPDLFVESIRLKIGHLKRKLGNDHISQLRLNFSWIIFSNTFQLKQNVYTYQFKYSYLPFRSHKIWWHRWRRIQVRLYILANFHVYCRHSLIDAILKTRIIQK